MNSLRTVWIDVAVGLTIGFGLPGGTAAAGQLPRRIETPATIFWDGFETADTQMWSNGQPADCEGGYGVADTNAVHGANTIEICETTTLGGSGPGLIDATYSTAQGADLGSGSLIGIGVLDELGPSNLPTRGTAMLGLSSGAARSPTDLGYLETVDHGVSEAALSGFTPTAAACPSLTLASPNDSVFLNLTLRTPPNAQSLALDLRFFTRDYPDFLCSSYNDVAVALLDPAPAGTTIGDIVFDSSGDPVTVNNAFVSVCDPSGPYPCPDGSGPLEGSGFDTGASTFWLRTQAPVIPDSVITLRIGIWDSGDHIYDSTLLVDDFRWSTADVTTKTVPAQ